jgi:flagellar hook-basal body complex protein FliE
MSDPLGLISGAGGVQGANPFAPARAAGQGLPGQADAPSFADSLREELARVNEKQAEADRAIVDLNTGARDDLENVLLATQEADNAFRMLLAVRNKMMEAYQELRDVRV